MQCLSDGFSLVYFGPSHPESLAFFFFTVIKVNTVI